LDAEINVVDSAKKIGLRFNIEFWLKKLQIIKKQCKNCIKVFKKECPKSAAIQVEKYLDIFDDMLQIQSRKLILKKSSE